MHKMRMLAVCMILVLSCGLVWSQNEIPYRFSGVPSCDSEQVAAFSSILLDVAVFHEVRDIPDKYVDTVKNLVREELARNLTSTVSSRKTTALETITDSLFGIHDLYRVVMEAYWDNPILCHQALEMVQRINEYLVRSYAFSALEYSNSERMRNIIAAEKSLDIIRCYNYPSDFSPDGSYILQCDIDATPPDTDYRLTDVLSENFDIVDDLYGAPISRIELLVQFFFEDGT